MQKHIAKLAYCALSVLCIALTFTSPTTACPCTPQTLNIAQVLDCDYDKTLIDIPVRLCDFSDRKVNVVSLPVDQTGASRGLLYQISNNFAQYGYSPKVDAQATAISTGQEITDSKKQKFRIVWRNQGNCPTGGVRFKVSAAACGTTSAVTDIVLVPPSRLLASSDFSLSDDGWKIVGKENVVVSPQFESTSRGLLNHYIHYEDKEVKETLSNSNNDESKWYFKAPAKFLYKGIHPAYYGTLEFTIGMSCGKPTQLNEDAYLVKFECATCDSGKGTTIAYGRVGTVIAKSMQAQQIVIPLVESSWRKDPENSLVQKTDWSAPSQAEFIEVLSKVSAIKILGDLTSWYECTAIDNVQLKLASTVKSKTTAKNNIPNHLVQYIGIS